MKRIMKKVLFIINTMGRAGAEKSHIALLKSIDYTRCSVSLLSVINRGELFADVPENVKILNKKPDLRPVHGIGGALYIALNALRQIFGRGYIFKFIAHIIKCRRLKINKTDKMLWLPLAETTPAIGESYDMAIAFIEGAATYYLAEKVKAEKKIAFVHVHYEKAGYKKEFDESYYKKMDYICCISQSVSDVFRSIYPEHANIIRVFPNIIDVQEIYDASEKQNGFSDTGDFDGLRILTVGRLHYQKGYDIAIPAFAKLIEQGYENIRWYVLGNGTEKPKLEKLIRRHNLNGKFILLGSRKNPYPYIRQCDFYVQPSRFEGFPLTLQEALILGKPCVTANFAGVSDLLEDGKNAVVIELSEGNIYNAVKKMADNAEFRERIAAAAKNIDFAFSKQFNQVNQTEKLYDVMDGKKWE